MVSHMVQEEGLIRNVLTRIMNVWKSLGDVGVNRGMQAADHVV